jgi:anti-sigma regulatory factor (Ser/Thr protein kinase)
MALAGQVDMSEPDRGKLALVVTEVASNLIKHAGGGELVIQDLASGQFGAGLDIMALDRGPGMSDVSRCLADGYSTAGSPGTGLGAASRLTDSFGIYSAPGEGTVLWARFPGTGPSQAEDTCRPQVGVVNLPAAGEQVCGDAWAVIPRDGRSLVLVVDGLGHGSPAAEAAEAAVGIIRAHRAEDPVAIIEAAHEPLRSTRGAAMAIALVDSANARLRYAGVGNISGILLDTRSGQRNGLVSQNGTVGHSLRKVQAFDYPWTKDSLLLMHSDGLGTHWNLDRYPGLGQRHPSLIAGVLYRDHKRGRDDVTILAVREGGAQPS